MRAYSYVRFSSPEQAKGNSRERQINAARKWCDDHSCFLDETLTDAGISAYRGANRTIGALRRFLDMVETGRVERGSYLIIESLDRLSRENVLKALPRFLDLINAGIHVVTLSDGQIYSEQGVKENWTSLILSIAIMARAHEESATKDNRSLSNWEIKRQKAKNEKLTAMCPQWLRLSKDRKSFELDQKKVKVVRQIFADTIAGVGMSVIAKRLNQMRVPVFASWASPDATWHPSAIKKIINNRAVIGEFRPARKIDGKRVPVGDVVEGYYPQIITKDEFYRAQSASKGRKNQRGRKGEGIANLISGLVHCAACGGSFRYVNKGARWPGMKSSAYLACSRAQRGLCDNRAHHRYERIEAELIHSLALFNFTRLLDRHDPDLYRGEALRAEIAEKSERIRKLIKHRDIDEVEAELINLEAERKELRRQLDTCTINAGQAVADATVDHHAEFVQLVAQMGAEMSADERFALRSRLAAEFRRLVDDIEATRDGMTVRLRSSSHHRVEFELVDQRVTGLVIQGWDFRDDPQVDPPHRIWWPRSVLDDPTNNLAGLFEQFVGDGQAASGS
jgi:DNA invertase Pin-like site-specific DNA recombinase